MERRLHAGPLTEKEKSQRIIQIFSSVFFLSLLIEPGLDFRFHWSSVPVPLVLVGDIGVLLGFWIVFLVFRENGFASATIEIRKGQKVIATGPYRFIRHPMYAGASLLVGSMPFALGSYWAFLFVGLMGAGLVARILKEESYLSKNLPGYTAYCQTVRYRLIPFIW
jgi:protein-S-isoprenylcysteine O-methyltransferase Ste14